MFENYFNVNLATLSVIGLSAGVLLTIFLLWSLVWKGFALWFAAKDNKKWWFIALMLINVAGILEIIYIFGFSEYGKKLRENFSDNKNKESEKKEEKEDEIEKSECECSSCEGCDCDCHKPIDSN